MHVDASVAFGERASAPSAMARTRRQKCHSDTTDVRAASVHVVSGLAVSLNAAEPTACNSRHVLVNRIRRDEDHFQSEPRDSRGFGLADGQIRAKRRLDREAAPFHRAAFDEVLALLLSALSNSERDGLIRASVQLGTAIIDVEVREPKLRDRKVRRLPAARRTRDEAILGLSAIACS
jgi:hypothetical protein